MTLKDNKKGIKKPSQKTVQIKMTTCREISRKQVYSGRYTERRGKVDLATLLQLSVFFNLKKAHLNSV